MAISKPLGVGVDVGVPIGEAMYQLYFSPDIPYSYWMPFFGPMENILMWTTAIMPGQDPRQFFGMPGGTQVVKEVFSGLKPVKEEYNGLTDFNRYSWGLGEVIRLSSPTKGGNLSGENQVLHTTVHGNVRPVGSSIYTYLNGVTYNIAGLPVEMPDQLGVGAYLKKYQMSGYSYPHDVGFSHVLHSDNSVGSALMFDRLPRIISNMLRHMEDSDSPYLPYTGGSTVLMVGSGGQGFSDVSFGENRVKYKHYAFAYGFLMRQMDVEVSFHVTQVDNPGVFTPGGQPIYRVDVQVTLDAQLYAYVYPAWVVHPAPEYKDPVHVVLNAHYTPTNVFMLSNVYDAKPNTMMELFSSSSLTLHGYEDMVRRDHHRFRPSVQYSTNQALKSLRESTANWIETLAEIEENLGLFPKDEWEQIINDLVAFSSAYKEKGAISWILRKLAKILANHVLLKGFAWSPNGSTATQLQHDLTGVANIIEGSSKRVIIHGSGTFNDLKDIHPKPTRFSVHTKVTIGGFDNPNVARILGLDKLGALPTGERIWATTKYSWLIDTFVNIGSRLNSLDTYVLLACLDASNFVHGFSYEFELSNEYLSSLGVESVTAVQPYVRVYIREKSAYIPALFAAQHAEAFVPDKRLTLAIALALVAQMFISVPIDLAYGGDGREPQTWLDSVRRSRKSPSTSPGPVYWS